MGDPVKREEMKFFERLATKIPPSLHEAKEEF
jgi:hypothetical protein